jgi:hypothetical protein
MKLSALALLSIAWLAGCSSPSSPSGSVSQVNTKPATDAMPGRSSFQNTYISARGWTADAQPFLEESQPTKEVTGIDGKSAVWRARFGSLSRSTAKSFVWSGTDAADAPPRGVSLGSEDSYSPTNASTRPFDLAFLKSDSDEAFKVAQQHGGKKLLEKDPTLPVFYRLQWDMHDGALLWHVMYGGANADSILSVTVNASTGQFIRVEK